MLFPSLQDIQAQTIDPDWLTTETAECGYEANLPGWMEYLMCCLINGTNQVQVVTC